MADNNIIRFADPANSGANVTSQVDYVAKTALINQGFQAGVASSADFNKLAAQLSSIVTAVAQMVVDQAGTDVNDTDTTATIEANLVAAIQAIITAYHYAPLNSPNLIGVPTVPTVATSSDASTKIASTGFVQNSIAGKAPIESPTFTGTPAASTPAANDNSSKLSTTSFVNGAITAGTGYNAKFNSAALSGMDATGAGQLRLKNGNYSAIFRQDGATLWLLMTPSGSPDGSFNSLRPIAINMATGAVTIDQTGAGTSFGGIVNAPAPALSDNSTKLVNSNWVQGLLDGAFVTDFANPGYILFHSGLAIQFVSNLGDAAGFDVNGNKSLTWTFPYTFKHACFCTVWSTYNGGALLGMNANVQAKIPSISSVDVQIHASGTISGPLAANGIAIGW